MPVNSHLEWQVPYEPGILSAKGYKDGKVVATAKQESTDEPASVALVPDRVPD